MDPHQRYLSTNEAARYLGATPKSVYHRVAARAIPFIKVGKKLWFDRQALDQWLQAKRVRSKVA